MKIRKSTQRKCLAQASLIRCFGRRQSLQVTYIFADFTEFTFSGGAGSEDKVTMSGRKGWKCRTRGNNGGK